MSDRLCNNLDAVKFVQKFKEDARHVAVKLEVPVENILGLAAEESQYGTGRIAREYNNYFSMHAPAPRQTGEAPAQGSTKVKVAKYESFKECAKSFEERFGRHVQKKMDPTEFAKALIVANFNTGNSTTGGRDDFVPYLVGIIKAVGVRLTC